MKLRNTYIGTGGAAKRTWAGLLLAGLWLLAGCGGEGTGEEGTVREQPLREIVVALKPDKNPDAMLEDQTRLEAYLRSAAGLPVEVIIPMSGAVIEQGMANGTIDLAFLSSTSAARYAANGIGEVMLAVSQAGATTYRSYWVGRADSDYESIAELRGKPVSFASPTSTSGYIIPVHDLKKRGLLEPGMRLEDVFGRGNVQFGTGYVSAIERVLNGRADAAAVSDYVMDEDKHLTAGQKARLRVIQDQGPVPTHVLFVRDDLPEEQRDRMEAGLKALGEKETALASSIFGGELVEISARAHLRPIREALAFVEAL